MSFHGHFRTDEPPGGDYVRYIESLVGGPPEDAEQAAIELAQRLGSRQPLTAPLDLTATPVPVPAVGQGRAHGNANDGALRAVALGADGTPGATATGATMATRRAPTPLRQLFSRILVLAGAALVGLGFIAPEAVSMAPGIILLFAGFAVGRQAGRRGARTRSGTT